MAEQGYERGDVSVRAAVLAGVGLALTVVVMAAAVWLLVVHVEDAPINVSTTDPSPRSVRGPALQRDPQADLADFRSLQRAELNVTEWVDRQRGIARIPVDRAMAILAERGWPDPTAEEPQP